MSGEFDRRLRSAFDALVQRGAAGVDAYCEIYDDEAYFEDPAQRLYGKGAIAEALRRMMGKVRDVSFDIHSLAHSGDEVYLTWTMRFRPAFGPAVAIEGASHLRRRGDLVLYHRDYWDLLASVLDSMPLAAMVYRGVLKRLALAGPGLASPDG